MTELSAESRSPANAASPPSRKVVLLGASNVAIAWRTIFELIRSRAGRPVEIWGAFGHGRSYGVRSRVLGRGLPGITECGLWSSLAGSASGDTTAVVTDLGNDLMYGSDVPQIMRWVTWCVDRLREQSARTVLTRLPVDTVRQLSPIRFRVLRSLLFPRCGMTHDTAVRAAEELDAAVVELAARSGIPIVDQNPAWYGFDPIHVRRQQRQAAWSEILGRVLLPSETDCPGIVRPSCPRLWRLAPERRWLFGEEQTRAQPARVLEDGTRIHLF